MKYDLCINTVKHLTDLFTNLKWNTSMFIYFFGSGGVRHSRLGLKRSFKHYKFNLGTIATVAVVIESAGQRWTAFNWQFSHDDLRTLLILAPFHLSVPVKHDIRQYKIRSNIKELEHDTTACNDCYYIHLHMSSLNISCLFKGWYLYITSPD